MGTKGYKFSKETLKKIQDSRKKKLASMTSEERKERWGKRKGVRHTLETKQKMRDSRAKHLAATTAEQRSEMWGSFKDRKHTEETKKKISVANTAFWKVNERPVVTDKQREKISLGVVKAMVEGRMNFANRPKEYARGHFESAKAGRVYYRSALELLFYKEMDTSILIKSFEVEPLWLAYTNPEDNKTHRYVPDMLVTFVDGTKKLVELKPTYRLSDPVNQAKFREARVYAKKQGWTFEVWTEKAVA